MAPSLPASSHRGSPPCPQAVLIAQGTPIHQESAHVRWAFPVCLVELIQNRKPYFPTQTSPSTNIFLRELVVACFTRQVTADFCSDASLLDSLRSNSFNIYLPFCNLTLRGTPYFNLGNILILLLAPQVLNPNGVQLLLKGYFLMVNQGFP